MQLLLKTCFLISKFVFVPYRFYWFQSVSQSWDYRQVSHIRRTLVDNKIVDHSDVVGASPVGAAPTTSSFSTHQLVSLDWAKTTAWRDEKHLSLAIWGVLYQRFYGRYWSDMIWDHFTIFRLEVKYPSGAVWNKTLMKTIIDVLWWME